MTDAAPEVVCLAGVVAGLFVQQTTHQPRPTWRAWTPDELVVLFESEHEEVARMLVVLLAGQLDARSILLESPDGAESYYREGRWQAADLVHGPVAPASDRHERQATPHLAS